MTDQAKLKRRIGAARKFWERSHYRPTRGGKPTALVWAIATSEKVSPDVVARVVDAALAQAELEALAELCE